MRCHFLAAAAAAAGLSGLRGGPHADSGHPVLHARADQEETAPPCPEAGDIQFVLMNLNRRSDRLSTMEKRLPPWICSKVCRFPAVDGRTMGRPSFVSAVDWEVAQRRSKLRGEQVVGGKLTLGAIGLLDSSRQLWERAVATNKTTVIMEDDIVFDNLEKVSSALCVASKRNDWDVVQFQYDKRSSPKSSLSNPLRLAPGMYCNTGMYMITPAAAQRALRNLQRGEHNQLDADHGPLRGSGLRGFHVVPRLVAQAGKRVPGVRDKDTDVQIVLTMNQVSRNVCPIKDCI